MCRKGEKMVAQSKFILTMIAVALSVVALQHVGIVTAYAQNGGIHRVMICGDSGGKNPNARDGSWASVYGHTIVQVVHRN